MTPRKQGDKMSTMATQTTISLEEYLKTVPDPDVEYVNGSLKERPLVSCWHGIIQSEICSWFTSHRKEWKLLAGVEVRMQTTPTTVHLPDVVVDTIWDWPPVLVKPPLVAIEILSPGDSMSYLEGKCDAYSSMGIANIWIVNPMLRNGRIWKNGEWFQATRFEVAGTSVYLDLEWLFSQIDDLKKSEFQS
jgi:Uma2 family endonuclease